jgi:trk system potassium uptake protein TrkA
LRSVKLKKNLIIAAVIRENAVIYPNGETTLEAGDAVIVMTTNEQFCDLDDILA